MSQKRKHTETAEESSSAPKPFKKHRAFKPGQNHQQPKQHRRLNLSHDDEHGRSTNALKSRIRDLKRFMAHMDSVEKHKMSAGARQERERELEACEHELAEKLLATREADYRSKMIGKYHQVRFFGRCCDIRGQGVATNRVDRQKGTRILKRLKKEHAAQDDNEKKGELRQRIHNAEVDVNYAIYYPLMKPYSSLYPKTKTPKPDESADAEDDSEDSKNNNNNNNNEIDGPKGNIEMWKAIEQAMEDRTLERLRHSKDALPAEPPKKIKKPKVVEKKKKPVDKTKTSQVSISGTKRYGAQEEEEDSDGGFFE
jgi:hypothetical protein